MIGVKIWGGLGNQLFQYAFGLYLAEKRNEKPFFFKDFINKSDLELNNFEVSIELLSLETLKKNGYGFQNYFLYRLKRKLLQTFPFLNKKILVENVSIHRPEISDTYSLFDGYWQAYKYLLPIEQKLREQLVCKGFEVRNLQLYEDVRSHNSVSIHIRRGDYLNTKNSEIYENLAMEYYENAIQFFLKELVNPIFYIFSNDLDWVDKNLKMSKEIHFVIVNNTENLKATLADLLLMSSCKHHIIGNSTFSWWGAWLNPSLEKKVIAPKKWYKGKMNDLTSDLIPAEWVRL